MARQSAVCLINMTLHESVTHGKLDEFKELLSAAAIYMKSGKGGA